MNRVVYSAMPIYKIQRAKDGDILRKIEIEKMMDGAPSGRSMTKPLIAFLWIFGKRVSEVITLKRKHIFIEEGRLNVRFFILKQGSKGKGERSRTFMSLDHPFVPTILDHIEEFEPDEYIFPGNQKGHISRQHAWNLLKEVDEGICPHWFRHSLATRMAEKGATEDELMDWFDWMSSSTAHDYVERSGNISERFAERDW